MTRVIRAQNGLEIYRHGFDGFRVRPSAISQLRESLARRLRDDIAGATESLLQQWSVAHADHLSEIRHVWNDEARYDLDRFICAKDGATLTLKHEMTMKDNILSWTVTPLTQPA